MTTILIADDDRTTVRLLQTLLELDGFRVCSVGRGSEVPAAITTQKPDLLLVDYRLIDMDGIEVIRRVRAEPATKTLPIVMASGMDVEVEAKEAGASAFLVKPFEPDELTVLFNRLLNTPTQ
jgi:CheY-like chemotaxis protein